MKYCKDCKWVERQGFWILEHVPDYPKCLNPELANVSGDTEYMITGEPKRAPYASTCRTSKCGPEARYFEPNAK